MNSRKKGSRFERQIAKQIVDAFKKFGIEDEDCYRTPLSGGHVYASKKDPGDLQFSTNLVKLFPVSVECKFYKTFNWFEAVDPRGIRGKLKKWWNQATKAANGRVPILVFKKNGSQIYAMADVGSIQGVLKHTEGLLKMLPRVETHLEGSRMVVVSFARLLESFVSQAGGK